MHAKTNVICYFLRSICKVFFSLFPILYFYSFCHASKVVENYIRSPFLFLASGSKCPRQSNQTSMDCHIWPPTYVLLKYWPWWLYNSREFGKFLQIFFFKGWDIMSFCFLGFSFLEGSRGYYHTNLRMQMCYKILICEQNNKWKCQLMQPSFRYEQVYHCWKFQDLKIFSMKLELTYPFGLMNILMKDCGQSTTCRFVWILYFKKLPTNISHENFIKWGKLVKDGMLWSTLCAFLAMLWHSNSIESEYWINHWAYIQSNRNHPLMLSKWANRDKFSCLG